jgi:hypothetical protein
MAMAMDSERVKPSSPTKAGILTRPLVLSVGVALLGLDDVELDVVRLSDSADGCRTAVVLEEPRTSQ